MSSLFVMILVQSVPLSWWVSLLIALPGSIYLLHRRATRLRTAPTGLPWVGLRDEWFSQTRASWRELWMSKVNIEDGYQKYSKSGTAFVTPNQTYKPEVVLPPESIPWLIAQPDSILSIYRVLIDDVEFTYTSPRSWLFHRPFHVEALNKMDLNLMTDAMIDEIDLRLGECFGTVPDQWKRVSVQSSMYPILTRITNRVFVGKGLAHDDAYFCYANKFVWEIIIYANIIARLLPSVVKPILGHIIALPLRYYDYRCSRFLVPILQRHLLDAHEAKETQFEHRNPDMLQLLSRFAVRSADPLDRNPRALCSRLLALNFVGIHTSSSAAIAALIDILCAGFVVFTALRDEAAAVLEEAGSRWDRAAVNKLVLLDSTLRESMRFSAFKARGVERQVVQKGGVRLPDGTLLPEGTKVGMPTTEIHMDPDFYDDPRTFKFDRFVGKAELGMVNTTDTFLAFGHGRHACPGRFFSAHELKLLFAHVLLNYDFQFFDRRPETTYFSDFCTLADDVFCQVRRRQRSAHLD